MLQRDQRHYEESFKNITKEHDVNKIKMFEDINKIESQVYQKRYIRDNLSQQEKQKFEQQLDYAVKQMMHHINHSEQDQDIDESFYKQFIIRPSFAKIKFPNDNRQRIDIAYTQRNNKQDLQNYENDSESPLLIMNSGAQRQKTPNIPKLPIDKISIIPGQDMKPSQEASSSNRFNSDIKSNVKNNPKQPNQLRTNRGSSRQYSQASQRSQRAQIINQNNQNGYEDKGKIQNYRAQSIPEVDEKEETVIITNPVMVGGMNQSSKFEHKYEDDYDGANVTLDMQTERLKQFPEEYEMLQHIQDPDQRILLKQQVFFVYEKILRKQAKQEKKRRKKEQKEKQRQIQDNQEKVKQNFQEKSENNDNKQKNNEQQKILITNNNSQASSANNKIQSRYNGNVLGMNERHIEANDISQIVTSRFSLQSELPSIDTQEIISAQKRYRHLDVNKSEIIDLEVSVNGLKTATQKSLIKKIDEEFKQKEILKKQLKDNEIKMNYSSSVVSKINSGSNYDNYDLSNKDGNYNSNNYLSNNNDQQRNEKLIWIAESDSNRSPSDKNNQISNSCIEIDDRNSPKLNRFHQLKTEGDYVQTQNSERELLPQLYEQIDLVKHPQMITPSLQKQHKKNSNHSKANSMSSQKMYDRQDLLQEVRKSNIKEQSDQNSEKESEEQLLAEQYKNIEQIKKSRSSKSKDNEFKNSKQLIQKRKQQDQNYQSYSQRHNICDSSEKQGKSALEVIQERMSEFSQSLITNAARLNSHRSRQSKTNINQYENNGSVANKKGNSVNFSSITINSNNQQSNLLNRQESLSYIHESSNKKVNEFGKDGLKDSSDNYKKVNFRSISQQAIIQNENDFYNNSKDLQNNDNHRQFQQKEIIKIENQKQRFNRLNINQKNDQQNNLKQENDEENQIQRQKLKINNFLQNNFKTQLNTERTNTQNIQTQNMKHQSLSHRSYVIIPDKNKLEINAPQQNQQKGLAFQNILQLNKNEIQNQQQDQNKQNLYQNDEYLLKKLKVGSNDSSQSNDQLLKKMKINSQIQQPRNSVQIINEMPCKTYNGSDIFIGQVDLNGSLENLNKQHQKLIQNFEVYNAQDSIGQQIFRIDNQNRERPQLIRSNSECQLRDKEFYDMCDDEDEIVLYCKLAEQSVLDAIHLRNLSDFHSKIKVATVDNEHFRNSITQNQLDFAQNYSESLKKLNLVQKHQSSSQNANNKMIFMSQKTMNKMFNRYLQTQEKTQLLIEKQFVSKIIDHEASVTVDQNSSQQQTRGKATFNRIMFGGAIQNGLLKFPQQNQNQNNNQSNYLGTNLLQTSFNDCTLPFCHNIMMPTHQYNRRTLLMMQNLHNNYLYSANSGILFTQRGWNSGLAAQMTSDNGSSVGRLGTKIGQSLRNLSNIVNINKESHNDTAVNRTSEEMDKDENDLRVLNNPDNKNNSSQMNFDSKIIEYQKDVILLSGEPVNISNFIFGAKQQTQDQKNQSCITIVDDDCKMMIDRKLLNEVKNQSHQMKFRSTFLQSNKTSTRIPQYQQSSSDFSQQQTEHRKVFNFLKGMSSQIKSNQSKKFDFNSNDNLSSKKIEILGLGQKKQLASNQILIHKKQAKNQEELSERGGNQQKIIIKKKENQSIIKQPEVVELIKTQRDSVNTSENQKQLKSFSVDQNSKLKKMNGNTKILNLITGLKQIQQRQAIKKQNDSNNNTMNIIQLLDQQKRERANRQTGLSALGIKNEQSEDKSLDMDQDNKLKQQDKLLIASSINRLNNNSVQIQKRKIKSCLGYQTEQIDQRQNKQINTINQDYN